MICFHDLIWGQANWWKSLQYASFRVWAWKKNGNNHAFFHIEGKKATVSFDRIKLVISKLSIHVQVQNEIICHNPPTSKAANKRLSKFWRSLEKKINDDKVFNFYTYLPSTI